MFSLRISSARVPITAVAVFGVGLLIACAVGIALFLGLASASRNTDALWVEQSRTLIDSMVASLDEQLAPVVEQGKWVRQRVADGRLNLDDTDALDLFFAGVLAGTPQVAGLSVVDAQGMSRRWGRADTAPIVEDWSDRRPIRDWLADGRSRETGSWQMPFWTPTLDITVLLHDEPLRRDGRFLGMLGQVVPVAHLSVQLIRSYAETGLVPFVLYGRRQVLAHPLVVESVGERIEDPSALVDLDELGDPILTRIWTPDAATPASLAELTELEASVANYRGRNYLFLFRVLERFGPEPWTVGAYIDTEEHGGEEVARMKRALVVGIVVLLAAVILATLIGLRVSRRIEALSGAARAVRSGNLTTVPPLERSGIREIDEASRSFEQMIEGLRERNMIRETLGRFVPEQIAHALLDDGGHLEPMETEATLLFCDLEGFTALTESLGARGIVTVLNAFFSEMVRILKNRGGVVTQFQGDAILATFNNPLPNRAHAANALRAALEMVRRTETGDFGGQRLRIRIGVNTGTVVAGAVGAEGRLSYTVHGDAVNLAARLEAMNKKLGTRILASDAVVAMAEGFVTRLVEETEVRGRSQPARVYEIIAGPD